MSFLGKLVTRAGNPLESPSVPLSSLSNASGWLLNWANGAPTDSGEQVTPLTALQVTTVVACVKLIAEGVAQLPLQVIERLNRGRRVAHEHLLFDLLSAEWNNETTAFVAMQVSLAHALLWGTSYVEVQRDNGNRILGLWPRKPWLTEPKRMGADLAYVTTDTGDGKSRVIAAADMLVIPGLSLDGWVGHNVVSTARQSIGLAMALERHAARYFGNGATSTGTLEVPGELSDTAFQRLRTSLESQITGANRFRAMVLEGGTKWNTISSSNNEAQFIESRKQSRSEICSLFRCPLHMVASDESRGVKSNTAQVGLDFLTFTLQPWLIRYQQEFNRKLFRKTTAQASKYEVRFHTHSLMAADSSARMQFYVDGRNAGILTSNECRILEGLEPAGPEGDLLMVPLNMVPATRLLDPDASEVATIENPSEEIDNNADE